VKIVLLIAVPSIALFVWSLSRLSIDALGMALGMILGIVAGLPSAVLVITAIRHPAPAQPDYIDAPTVYADEVTPYTHLFRRVARLPALPDRQTQISEMRAVLDYIEANEVQR